MRLSLVSLLFLLLGARVSAGVPSVQTIFVIVMENHDWSEIAGSTNAPYLNQTLLPQAAWCAQYYNPPGLHPSEPNYLWLEAGTNFGVFSDLDPAVNHQASTNHLVTLLHRAGISWKAYEEDIDGLSVPLTSTNEYTPRHDPFVYFDDVTGTNNPSEAYALAHIRPFRELATDLTNGTVARYNFITPNLCHDMHNACAPLFNPVRQGDDWLAVHVPKILASPAYRRGGALFITWDESETGDGPIGLLLLSPLGKGGGYCSTNYYTHSSLLRTLQESLHVGPLLGDAANAADLGDLFRPPPATTVVPLADGSFSLTATGLVPGTTNVVLASRDLIHWTAEYTNLNTAGSFTFLDDSAVGAHSRFYRVIQAP